MPNNWYKPVVDLMSAISLQRELKNRLGTLHGNLWRICVVIPEPIEVRRIRLAVGDYITITKDKPFPGFYFEATQLRRRIVKERIVRIDAHRGRSTEVDRMVQNCHSHHASLNRTIHPAPAGSSSISISSRLPFRSEERDFMFIFPIAMSTNSHSTVSVFFEYQGARGCAFLRRNYIEDKIARSSTDVVESIVPFFI